MSVQISRDSKADPKEVGQQINDLNVNALASHITG